MRRIARRRPRFGSPRIHDELMKRGWEVNHKRVERLWREEGMQVPRKQRKRRRSCAASGGSENSCVRKRPLRPDHVWSYDFVEDRTEEGRKLRMLVVIDEFTRESLAIEVARSFTARHVVEVLQYFFAVRGAPEYIRSDNGPEFVAQRSDSLAWPGEREDPVHCQGEPLGERLRREFQQPLPGRNVGSRVIPRPSGRPLGHRSLAARLQSPAAS